MSLNLNLKIDVYVLERFLYMVTVLKFCTPKYLTKLHMQIV